MGWMWRLGLGSNVPLTSRKHSDGIPGPPALIGQLETLVWKQGESAHWGRLKIVTKAWARTSRHPPDHTTGITCEFCVHATLRLSYYLPETALPFSSPAKPCPTLIDIVNLSGTSDHSSSRSSNDQENTVESLPCGFSRASNCGLNSPNTGNAAAPRTAVSRPAAPTITRGTLRSV